LVLCVLAVAAGACGGKTDGGLGGGGSSSGGGSGSSSGSSGGSGSSSGGAVCEPLAGCSSTTTCPAGDGCNTCSCSQGSWACTTLGCGDDVSDPCPAGSPTTGDSCSPDGLDCAYPTMEGCGGDQCTCSGGIWLCNPSKCPPPPPCPASEPAQSSICASVGQECTYTTNGCGPYCYCDPSGTWSCYEEGCVDAGPPDAATTD
jgi:hypothetical protein